MSKRKKKKAAPPAPGAGAGTGAAGETTKAASSDKAASSKDEKAKHTGPRRVRAIALGFHDNKRRREGNVFTIANAGEFSPKWMVYVDQSTPEKTTTGQQELQQKHDELLGERLASKGGTGGANPLGAE